MNSPAALETGLRKLAQPANVRTVSIVTAVIFAGLAVVSVMDLKKTFIDSRIEAPATESANTNPGTQEQPQVSVQNIAQWHLFGQVQQKPVEVEQKPITAPETRLNLKLNGIIASDGNNSAGAIIEKNPNQQEYVAVGDSISSGVVLKEVYTDRVILDRNGRLETLSLPKTSINISSSMSDAPAQTVRPTPVPTPAVQPNATPSVGRDAADTKKLLEKYREMILQRQERLKQQNTDKQNEPEN